MANNPSIRLATSAAITLDRVRSLSYEEFIGRYAVPRKPVVLEDAISDWPALRKWTPEFWLERYKQRCVEIDGKPQCLGEVIQLALKPKCTPPPYYRNIQIRRVYPELLADISPDPIFCRPNWFHSVWFKPLNRGFRGYGEYELFIGGAGQSYPFLHFDGSYSFLYQIQGRKVLVLFPPGNTAYLYPKTGSEFNCSRIPNIDDVSLDEFPLFARTTRIHAEIGPGDTLFLPHGWWHTSHMLSFSITVATDVANETNWEDVASFLARRVKARLGVVGTLSTAYLYLMGTSLGKTSRIPMRGGN